MVFVHNIKRMMTPKPDRILWCYGEYQTLYGTVEGREFQQDLPDLDNLDPREKHLIILDDRMDETDQRVASLFVLFHIDHHVAVRSDRSSGKGFQQKLRSRGMHLVC
jgi:hypothetical protein